MKYMFVIVLCVHFCVSAKSKKLQRKREDSFKVEDGLTGTLYFRAPSPSFSTSFNATNFLILLKGLVEFLKTFNHPVDTVAIRHIRYDQQLLIDISVFPLGAESFTQMAMTLIGFAFSNHNYKPPAIFGPYIFKPNMYHQFSDGGASKSPHMDIVIGLAIGASVLMLLLIVARVYALMQKKRAERKTNQNNPFGESFHKLRVITNMVITLLVVLSVGYSMETYSREFPNFKTNNILLNNVLLNEIL